MTLVRIIAAMASCGILIAALLDVARHGGLTLSTGQAIDPTTTMVFVLVLAAVAWTCLDAAISK